MDMRIRREALDFRVVVCRVSTGSAPFGWEVRSTDGLTPVHVSAERFRAMEAAYKDGQVWLADFLSRLYRHPGRKGPTQFWQSPYHGVPGFPAGSYHTVPGSVLVLTVEVFAG